MATPATPSTEQARRLAKLTARAARVTTSFAVKSAVEDVKNGPDSLNLAEPLGKLALGMMQRPDEVWARNMKLWSDSIQLWQAATARMMGIQAAPVVEPARGDRRFKHDGWTESVTHDVLKQSYLLMSQYVEGLVADMGDLGGKERERLAFHTRQALSGMSPANSALTNPEVLQATIEQRGENLVRGMESMLDDMEAGGTRLRLRMSDETAFEVGKDLATAEGSVVFETEMMQLIQFAPTTGEVAKRPLLIIPPWINKYYILDLRPKNSFIQWAVSKGFTVFIVSWVNPDESLRHKNFEDYLQQGALPAIDAVCEATGEDELNLVGYCIGGTLTAATLSILKQRGDQRVKSCTYLTTLTDFEDPGDIRIFIDDKQIAGIEKRMARRGFLEGFEMSDSFRLLRENGLVWNYVVDQYLLGNQPTPFDLLYWNEDTTRMPEAMHSFYLREMYLENKLVKPGAITLCDTPIDLTQVDMPIFQLSCERDHIAPWKSTYKATQLYSGEVTFVLGGSGHIAGVVNPPAKNKYGFRTHGTVNPADPGEWYAGSEKHEGSWWPYWAAWLAERSGESVPARLVAEGGLKEIEPAPGRYAKTRI